MAAAIIVPLILLAVLRLCWPRAATGARLAAFGAAFAAVWLMIALVSLSAAGKLGGWIALGLVMDIHGLGSLITRL